MSDDQKKPEEEAEEQELQNPVTGRRYARRTGDIHGQSGSSSTWLVSFTDVMALMLTFFVLLFSMAEPVKEDWSAMMSALQKEFNRYYGAALNLGSQDALDLSKIDFNEALDINYLEALLRSQVKDNKYLERVELIQQPGQLIIALPKDLLFDSGSAVVKEDGVRSLYALGGVLNRIKNKVEIAGHADPRPVPAGSSRYDSNWDLSLSRAASVSGVLNNVGYDRDIVIRGHASGRYDDLEGEVEEDMRLDLSRRVDVVILNHDGSKKEYIPSVTFK